MVAISRSEQFEQDLVVHQAIVALCKRGLDEGFG